MLRLVVAVLYSFQQLMQKNFHRTFSFPLWLLTRCESSRKGGIFSVLQIKETGNKGFAYRCQHMLLSSSAHLTCAVQPLQFRLCIDPWWPKPIKANRQVWRDKFSARFLLSLSSLSAALHTQLTTLSLALHLCCSLPFPRPLLSTHLHCLLAPVCLLDASSFPWDHPGYSSLLWWFHLCS